MKLSTVVNVALGAFIKDFFITTNDHRLWVRYMGHEVFIGSWSEMYRQCKRYGRARIGQCFLKPYVVTPFIIIGKVTA